MTRPTPVRVAALEEATGALELSILKLKTIAAQAEHEGIVNDPAILAHAVALLTKAETLTGAVKTILFQLWMHGRRKSL